jgi:prepilin-type processing-associated H-X9-DG protein
MHSVSRCGVTWVSLLVVFSIVTLLAATLLPPFWMGDHRHARRINCGNNQRQIVLGMAAYAAEHAQDWPMIACASNGWIVPVGDHLLDPTASAIGSLEFLAANLGGDLPRKIFGCPSDPPRRPETESANGLGETRFTSAWAAAGPQAIGYSYDWSTPRLADINRVVTADRNQLIHKDRVMVAYADGHMGALNRVQGCYRNPKAGDDDIYDDRADGLMSQPGAGSTTRAWVR